MAFETNQFFPKPKPFAFTGFNEVVTRGADTARAEIVFTGSETIPKPALVDDAQRIVMQLYLPQAFTYVLLDLALQIITDNESIDFWPNLGSYIQRPTVTLLTTSAFKFASALESPGPVAANDTQAQKQYSQVNKPSYVLIPDAGEQGLARMDLSAVENNGGEATFEYYIRYLQYDVNQAHHWAVNTPSYVRP